MNEAESVTHDRERTVSRGVSIRKFDLTCLEQMHWYTGSLARKYLFAKKRKILKERLLKWDPHKNKLDPKDINEKFPLKTLISIVVLDASTSWFADITNYHAENFVIKGMSTQQKRKFFKDKPMTSFMACHDGNGGHHVDYLSKRVEAKVLPTNDARVVCKFLKSLFSRFGAPCTIISDRGTHFCNDQFAKVMLKYGVTYRLSTAYHPQTSGQVEALKHANFDLSTAGDHRKVQPNKLNELRDHAYENSLIYKEKTKRIHDAKIKNLVFNVGDQVLLFNSILKMFSGKLKSHWSGLFTIAHVFPYGTVELSQNFRPNFKVNGHRIKHYFRGDVPKLVVPDLQTFPRTNEYGDWVKLSDPKQALRGRHPMLICSYNE
ncbi:reverse transcriptase domain-containing protein [Tanacetum coccineum]